MVEPDLPGEAPLQAYLRLVERCYNEDRLDAAMKVAEDAFERVGWQPGGWTALFNELVCEKDARDASTPVQVGGNLTLEIPRTAPPEISANVRIAAEQAKRTIGEALGVEWVRPVTITVFLPDAAVDFIFGSYGYVSHKTTLDKICLPHDTVVTKREAIDALSHEFAHVATYELAHATPPEWLDEGIATYLSRELSFRQSRFVISTAARTGRMISLRRIEGVLTNPDDRKDNPEMVSAAYLLSGSFIDFWVTRHGLHTVRDTLLRLREDDNIDRAVRHATGESLGDIERGWREGLR